MAATTASRCVVGSCPTVLANSTRRPKGRRPRVADRACLTGMSSSFAAACLGRCWARNMQELFYLTIGALMSVRAGRGATWSADPATKLPDGPYYFGEASIGGRTHDASAD